MSHFHSDHISQLKQEKPVLWMVLLKSQTRETYSGDGIVTLHNPDNTIILSVINKQYGTLQIFLDHLRHLQFCSFQFVCVCVIFGLNDLLSCTDMAETCNILYKPKKREEKIQI